MARVSRETHEEREEMQKKHVPAPGTSSSLYSATYCGRYEKFATGDHDLIRSLARQAVADKDADHYCDECLNGMEGKHPVTARRAK